MCTWQGCDVICGRESDLRRHVLSIHEKVGYWCPNHACNRSQIVGTKPFARRDKRNEHVRRIHTSHASELPDSSTFPADGDVIISTVDATDMIYETSRPLLFPQQPPSFDVGLHQLSEVGSVTAHSNQAPMINSHELLASFDAMTGTANGRILNPGK